MNPEVSIADVGHVISSSSPMESASTPEFSDRQSLQGGVRINLLATGLRSHAFMFPVTKAKFVPSIFLDFGKKILVGSFHIGNAVAFCPTPAVLQSSIFSARRSASFKAALKTRHSAIVGGTFRLCAFSEWCSATDLDPRRRRSGLNGHRTKGGQFRAAQRD